MKVAWPRLKTISRRIQACGWWSSIPGPGWRRPQESAAGRSTRAITRHSSRSNAWPTPIMSRSWRCITCARPAPRDVLDEITGSIGMTGAVDGTLILKRERGQAEASLFVTGRDIEREQQLALSFDATTALWSVIGNAEEVGRTRARQEIIDLLREQGLMG